MRIRITGLEVKMEFRERIGIRVGALLARYRANADGTGEPLRRAFLIDADRRRGRYVELPRGKGDRSDGDDGNDCDESGA